VPIDVIPLGMTPIYPHSDWNIASPRPYSRAGAVNQSNSLAVATIGFSHRFILEGDRSRFAIAP